MKKINLASGQRPFPKPWINIDIREQGYDVDLVADVRKLDMFEDNSIDIMIAHHVVEHFDMSQVSSISREWHRVLKPNGRLAIFVPNNEALTKAFIEKRIDDYIFNVNMFGAYQGHPADLHRWSYNHDYLIKQMGDIWKHSREITGVVLTDQAYQGSNCSLDWWILAREFIK